ncbi:hypothetical protein ACK3GY_002114 [Vibrio parahaemolyticus]
MSELSIGQVIAARLSTIDEDNESMVRVIDETLNSILEQTIICTKESVLDGLLKEFDAQIAREKGKHFSWHVCGDAMQIKYFNGRIDGVSVGKYLLENYFKSEDSDDE